VLDELVISIPCTKRDIYRVLALFLLALNVALDVVLYHLDIQIDVIIYIENYSIELIVCIEGYELQERKMKTKKLLFMEELLLLCCDE
jgi:hypothetical protein